MSDPAPELDIAPLVNAIARLHEGLERHRRQRIAADRILLPINAQGER